MRTATALHGCITISSNPDFLQKWHRAMEQWRTVDTGTKDITVWLQSAEGKLSTARNTLDPTEADALYKELEVSLRQHQGDVTRMNSAGEEILQGTSALTAHRLRDKLELINHRWKVLCAEVLTRQKRSMKENSVEPSEFTTEMDDLFSWIDEAENILASSLRPDLHYLEALLEKIKVGHVSYVVGVESDLRQHRESPPTPSTASWLEFDKSVSELRDWLRLLEHMLRSQKVAVGDLKDIEQMRTKQMVSLSLVCVEQYDRGGRHAGMSTN
ncbi:dystrophin [Elysia marginata]|uniref:Dystrophin n=1 Tax=Elysia marginata TaxID=1093978 RepID=A0AAV4ETI7_9GAST|nr:dystrophin [Elysia marginata]